MKLVFQILLLVGITTAGYSQSKFGIVKFHAFKQDSHPGMVSVDEKGNQTSGNVTTHHLLFVETTGKIAPRFDTIYIGSKAYSPKAELIKEGKRTFGKLTSSGKPASFKAAEGNRLWQLVLWDVTANPSGKIRSLTPKNEIVVTGKYKTSPFTIAIPKAHQLETILHE